MIVVFHDIMGNEVEYYVDDLVVKSFTRDAHWLTLKNVFDQCFKYNIKIVRSVPSIVQLANFLNFWYISAELVLT